MAISKKRILIAKLKRDKIIYDGFIVFDDFDKTIQDEIMHETRLSKDECIFLFLKK